MTEPEALDWTREQPVEDRLIAFSQKSYRPQSERTISPTRSSEGGRELMRGMIALGLLLALLFVLVSPFLLLATFTLSIDDFLNVMQAVGSVLLTPMVGLIGAVTGFYYGGQATSQIAAQLRESSLAEEARR